MKLVRKFTLALAIGILGVMVWNAYLRVKREVALLEADTISDQQTMGRALRIAAEWVWRAQGAARARELVDNANEREKGFDIRWLWTDGSDDGASTDRVPADVLAMLRKGRGITLMRAADDGEERRYTYVPVSIEGQPSAAVELSESLERQRAFIRTSVLQSVAATLGIVVVCGLIAMFIGAWFVGRPMRSLCQMARRVGGGDFSGRLILRQRDEIGELAEEINGMCDRLAEANQRLLSETEARIATLEQLRHADRLKTVGQLASGVAHELGTPLNVVVGRARMIGAGDLSASDVGRSAHIIVEQGERMAGIIRELLIFSRRRGPTLSAGSLPTVARQMLDMLLPLAAKHGVTLELDAEDGLPAVQVDQSQMQQALGNLVLNGMQAMSGGGRVRVTIHRRAARPPTELRSGECACLCVVIEDEGEGIAPADLPHLFEPFFTTKDVGEGTGLGLAVAYGIVQDHGGWIEVISEMGAGSRFLVFLPITDEVREPNRIAS